VQFVMRLALAVPFWKSGILKWNGFLKLSDTAVALFTDEFMLHLPGGPYHYPFPAVMAFLFRLRRNRFPDSPRAGSRHTRRRTWVAVHDARRGVDRARWVADPHHLGRDGARDYRLGAGAFLDRRLVERA